MSNVLVSEEQTRSVHSGCEDESNSNEVNIIKINNNNIIGNSADMVFDMCVVCFWHLLQLSI